MNYPWLDEAQQEFDQRFNSGRLAHACLLTGPQGLGKTELARQMAFTLLCQKEGQKACGVCRSCQLLTSGAHPDFRLITFEVNPKTDKLRTELVIDQVRELSQSMHLSHLISPRKVALIHPAEAMNRNAANALLKTLEEPPGDTVLLLVSHELSRLPATIRSRCQTTHIRLPDQVAAMQWLVHSQGADPVAAKIALQASAGSPLLAQQLMTQGRLQQFLAVEALLAGLRSGKESIAEVLGEWSGLDQEGLWNWLSLISAQQLRACLDQAGSATTTARTVTTGPGVLQKARQISCLQTLADRNRRTMFTALHKELLLRDWLIQWSRLDSS